MKKESFWWDEVPCSQAIGHGTKWHKAKAYRDGYRNSIKIVITDPVAHRFEMDGYYREREPLSRLISSAENVKTAQASWSDNVRQKSQLERE